MRSHGNGAPTGRVPRWLHRGVGTTTCPSEVPAVAAFLFSLGVFKTPGETEQGGSFILCNASEKHAVQLLQFLQTFAARLKSKLTKVDE